MARNLRYRRWTADTETAFLLALRLHGTVARACAEIGRSTHGAQDRRRANPDFATKWQKMLDDWQEAAVAERRAEAGTADPGVMPNRVRFDGFTPVRQRAFLRALTETGTIEEACKRIGISRQAAIKARRTYPSFAAAWDRAETHCEADLEQIAVERAIDGIEQQVAVGGQLVTRTIYPERLMAKMIDVRERRSRTAAAAAAAAPRHIATKEETDAVLFKKLASIEAHQAARERAAHAAQWAAWQEGWAMFGREPPARVPEQEVLPPLDDEDDDEDAGGELRWVRGRGGRSPGE